jgi:hypothetical protein
MKIRHLTITLVFLGLSAVALAQHDHSNAATADTVKKEQKKPASPRLSAMAMIGDNHVHIDYGAPSVRGRVIWNGLVAYNKVWASGAHKATWIEFGKDVMINGKHLPKGKYGFFTIPDKKTWTLIISKAWDMHLADDYKPENDEVRIIVKPKKNKDFVEVLAYEVISKGSNKGTIKLSWEKLNVSFDFISH